MDAHDAEPERHTLPIPLNYPPRPVRTPPAVMRARRERAMDIEYAYFKKKHPPPLIVFALGDVLFALNEEKKKVAHKIVCLDK